MAYLHEKKVWHARLNKSRVLRGNDPEELRRKADELMAQWEETWKRKQERELRAATKEQKTVLAEQKTIEAEQEVQEIENLLARGIARDPRIKWELLKDKTPFSRPKPTEIFVQPPSIGDANSADTPPRAYKATDPGETCKAQPLGGAIPS